MNLSERAKRGLFFCCLIVGVLALYIVMAHTIVDFIAAAYDQIVIDFGNPKDN